MMLGAALLVVGAALWGLGRIGFRGLPGDIRYETEHVRIYIPLATSLLLSLGLTLLMWLLSWISRR